MDKKLLLGKRIKELRKNKKLSQEQLAELVGVEPTTISNIENGYNYPKVATLEELSNALECNIGDFFNFEHLNPPEDLLAEITKILSSHPEKIQDFYKFVKVFAD